MRLEDYKPTEGEELNLNLWDGFLSLARRLPTYELASRVFGHSLDECPTRYPCPNCAAIIALEERKKSKISN